MSKRSVDMDMVARHAGVSRTTVHRALSGKSDINEETRRRVLEVADRLGYRPNPMARQFRLQRTATLGVVAVELGTSFWARMFEAVDRTLQGEQYGTLLACSYGDPHNERRVAELLLDKGSEGLLVIPSDPEANADFYNAVAGQGVPVVFLDRYMPGVNVDVVATDNLLGGYLAGRHLISLRRRHLVFITTRERDRHTTSVEGRLNGCNRALREAGLSPAALAGLDLPDDLPVVTYGYTAMQEYLKCGTLVDGVFAAADPLAWGAQQALEESGRAVPAEVSIVGFNDDALGEGASATLTTLRQPVAELGDAAVRLLLRRLQEGDTRLPRQRVMLEPSLVVRESCGGA